MAFTFLLGIFIGIAIVSVISRLSSIGNLVIDVSDSDDGPYLFLAMDRQVEEIVRKKYVTLKVDVKSIIPQK